MPLKTYMVPSASAFVPVLRSQEECLCISGGILSSKVTHEGVERKSGELLLHPPFHRPPRTMAGDCKGLMQRPLDTQTHGGLE